MFNNFIPNVWAAGINRELERLCVFVEDCNTQYEGTVKKQGESVTILGVGKPTITTISKAGGKRELGDPETIADTSVIMYINQLSTFNYQIDDIDEAQAKENVDGTLKGETSEALANEIDKFVASKAADDNAPKLYDDPVVIGSKEGEEGKEYVLDAVDKAIEKLQENDVADSTPIVITVSPKFFRHFKKAYRFEDTNNSSILKNGKIGMYGNVTVKRSNNVYKKDGVEYIMVRTKRAIAFAKPHTHTEAMRSTKWFCDVIRGFVLYDAKIVRPKEMVVIHAKYAA